MAAEHNCIFKRNSTCIFKAAPCDQDCDQVGGEESHRSHEALLAECLEGGDGKLALSRKVVSLLLQFP